MLRFLPLIVLFAVTGVIAQTDLSGVLATDLQTAQSLKKDEKWNELEAHAKQWSVAEIGNWRPWYYLGIALFNKNDKAAAVKALSQAVKLSPKNKINDNLRSWLADTHAELGNYSAAEVSYRRLLEKKKHRPDLWNKLRLVVLAQAGEDKRREESEILTTLLSYAGYINNYELWIRQAELLTELGDLVGVRNAYKNALRLMPKDIAVAEWVFLYDIQNGDAEAIDASHRHLLKIKQNHPMVNVYLGDKALAAGNRRLAKKYYSLAAQNQQYNREYAHALTALARLEPGLSASDAFLKYLSAIRASPDYLPAWQGAIVALRQTGQRRKASDYLSRMLRVERALAAGESPPVDILNGL